MLSTGMRVQNRYIIVEKLGSGGFGEVFAVRDEKSCHKVKVIKVLKVLNLENIPASEKDKAIALFQREAKVLSYLNHPGIPKVEPQGYFTIENDQETIHCLVMEKIAGENLLTWLKQRDRQPIASSLAIDWLKQLLEILQELHQNHYFHRDIKPENVLVSDDLRVYLIDFGFARIGGENLAMSSVAMGTFGFMAPEQTRNLQLTTASDLYGLGLTLVCVIARLKSHEIGEYVDYSNQLDQKAIEAKLKGCSFSFIEWLNQMVAPDLKKRFPDAQKALKTLQPLYVKRTPEIKLSCTSLDFQATKIGEKLTQTITVTNLVKETVLEGYWEVAPHTNDPPHTPDSHPWISFSPKTVKGTQVTCKVNVDTRQLQAEREGSRWLVFHSNANANKVTVALQVKTAKNPVSLPRYPRYLWLLENLADITVVVLGAPTGFAVASGALDGVIAFGGALVGVMVGVTLGVVFVPVFALVFVFARALGGAFVETGAFARALGKALSGTGAFGGAGALSGALAFGGALAFADVTGAFNVFWPLVCVGGIHGFFICGFLFEHYEKLPTLADRRSAWFRFWIRFILSLICGGGIGAAIVLGFTSHILIPIVTLGAGAGLVFVSILPMLDRRQLAAQRRKEHYLIEP